MSSATLAASASPHSVGDEVQRDIDARRDAGTRCDRAIHHEDPVVDHLRLRRERAQRGQQLVVRRAAPARRAAPRAPRAACPSRSSPGDVLRSSQQRIAEHAVQPARGGRLAGVTSLRCSVG